MPRQPNDDEYSEQEIIARRDATIKRMLNTPPKPHSEMKIGKRKHQAKQSSGQTKRADKASNKVKG
jgi:hypothetical protein